MKRDPSYEDMERKLQWLEDKLKEESEKTAKLKSILLSNLHHEIRTPMNAILGYSNLLATEDIPDEKKALYLEYIKQGNQRLMNFIDDLIDASLLELGAFKLEEHECYINRLFNTLYDHFNANRRSEKHYVISLLLNKELQYPDFMIWADDQRVYQAIFKILQSAFDCSELGVIEFGYQLDELKLYFFMKDSRSCYLGKSEKDILTLQEFDEIKTFRTNHFDLGLTIAEKIVKQMHGRIWVQNKSPKEGYCIRFEVPIKIPGYDREYKIIKKDSIFIT